jgi:Mrp family chromosome partitioning ATPase
MPGGQYVVLGMARPQAPWFSDVARWANSGALPVDFVKVLSLEELCARLRSGRVFSALLIDAGVSGCDRDLFDLARGAGCAVVVIDDRPARRPWADLGAATVLSAAPGRDELLAALREAARPVQRADEADLRVTPSEHPAARSSWQAPLVVLTGAGGTGRSTLAMALAAGLAADPRDHGAVVLADGSLHAQQGLLHDAGDVVPGLSELVDAHRSDDLDPDQIRQLCFQVGDAGYHLLLGLRRQRDWAALRPRALAAALDGLRRSYRAVVAEVDADVEGESTCGSVDVEERNLLARTSLMAADVVVAVGLPGLGGLHSLVRVLGDLRELGVEPARVMPVLNRAPRSPRVRADLSRALGTLTGRLLDGADLASAPLFVPERRRLDDLLRDNAGLPASMGIVLASAVRAVLDRVSAKAAGLPPAPVAVPPGSLGSWTPYPREGTG